MTDKNIPYKHVRAIARRFGYKGLKEFDKHADGQFTATDRHTGKKILIDVSSETVLVWSDMKNDWE
ncbi:hypothetical protein [Enterococcus sp. LJL90]